MGICTFLENLRIELTTHKDLSLGIGPRAGPRGPAEGLPLSTYAHRACHPDRLVRDAEQVQRGGGRRNRKFRALSVSAIHGQVQQYLLLAAAKGNGEGVEGGCGVGNGEFHLLTRGKINA